MAHWVYTLIIAITGTGSVVLHMMTAHARERAGLPPPVRVKRLISGLIIFLLNELFLIFVFYAGYSHGFSVDSRIWLLLFANTVAIVVTTFGLVLRRLRTGSWRIQNS
jgi:hypothetical protein